MALPTSRGCYWRTLHQPDSLPPRAARFAWETSWRYLPKVQLDYARLLRARLMGASQILVVDSDPFRLRIAKSFGATALILAEDDAVSEIREFTGGRGVDVAIEALGTQGTFENALRVLRPGGTLSS